MPSHSCDSYYYTLAVKLGIDTIAKYAHEVGLGQKTGIDLPDEIAGVMPSTEWAMRDFHRNGTQARRSRSASARAQSRSHPSSWPAPLEASPPAEFSNVHTSFCPTELSPDYRQAILDSFPGSGESPSRSIPPIGKSSPMIWPM